MRKHSYDHFARDDPAFVHVASLADSDLTMHERDLVDAGPGSQSNMVCKHYCVRSQERQQPPG